MSLIAPTPQGIAAAIAALAEGRLLGLPTETVYGLAGDATRPDAVAAIFAAKGRPAINPLIVHTASTEAGFALATQTPLAEDLAARFWPGPLTLVLPLRPEAGLAPAVTAGLETVALRVPAHPVAQAVLAGFARPVAAPSANRSGRLSATDPAMVARDLGEACALILAAGPSAIGLESTVLDLTGPQPLLLRPGAVTAEDLALVLGAEPLPPPDPAAAAERPRSPGLLLQHYAPQKPLRIGCRGPYAAEEGVLLFGPNPFAGKGGAVRLNLSPRGDLAEAASHLFAMLARLDQDPALAAIAVAPIPSIGLGLAINDRLSRAARR